MARNARLARLLTIRAELDALILDEMEPLQRQVFEYVLKHPGTTSPDLVRDCDMVLTHASTVLKQLADLGLLIRADLRDEAGRIYAYYRR